MILALSVITLVGALGGLLVRSGPPLARWLGWLVLLVVVVAALDLPVPVAVAVPPRIAVACTAAGADAERLVVALRARQHDDEPPIHRSAASPAPFALAAALAAAHAGPRSGELVLAWTGPTPLQSAAGSLGAVALTTAPAALFGPEALQATVLQPPAVGRPATLQVRLANVPVAASIAVSVRDAGQVVYEQRGELVAHGALDVPWLPAAAGRFDLVVRATVGAHTVERRGELTVAVPPAVLVLEPGDVAAAALRAQGFAVVEAPRLPAELPFAAVVVGKPLTVAEQQRLALAVDDGLGLFVLAPAFGKDGEPIRALLPLLPEIAEREDKGEQKQPGPPGPPEPPPDKPPQPPPSPPRPPQGDTSAARPDPGPIKEVDRHSVAMVLLVDRSGSMGAPIGGIVVPGLLPGERPTRMSMAKTSARQTASALEAGDQIGIVTFGNKGAGRVELPLVDVTDRVRVQQGIDKLAHAAEQTFLLAGLQQANNLLGKSRAAVRHCVVISDGEFYPVEELPLYALAERMRSEGITLSIVSIDSGDLSASFRKVAENVAAIGGGAFFPVPDATAVPRFVSAEVVRSLAQVGRQPRRDDSLPGDAPPESAPPKPDEPKPEPKPEPEPPPSKPPEPAPPQVAPQARIAVRQVADSPLLEPVPTRWPTLGAVVPGRAPFDAHVLLVAGDQGAPLLAFGHRGLGRVAAFAADLGGDDGAEFRGDPSFPGRFGQWLQSLLVPQPSRAPAPLLAGGALEPPAPTPTEIAALAAMAGQPVVTAPQLPASPGPRTVVAHRGQAADHAIHALLALLVLALGEWACARWLRQ